MAHDDEDDSAIGFWETTKKANLDWAELGKSGKAEQGAQR